MEHLLLHLLQLHHRLQHDARSDVRSDVRRDDRGDVPGWVLVTVVNGPRRLGVATRSGGALAGFLLESAR